jgi:hypothetical protein
MDFKVRPKMRSRVKASSHLSEQKKSAPEDSIDRAYRLFMESWNRMVGREVVSLQTK